MQQHLDAWQGRQFVYGKADCALFVAGAVQAMTGQDLARGLRGYRSEAEGLRKVRAKGFADHVDVYAQSLPVADRLRHGDVAVITHTGERALGIVQGARGIYLMHPSRGLALVPLSWATGGFTV